MLATRAPEVHAADAPQGTPGRAGDVWTHALLRHDVDMTIGNTSRRTMPLLAAITLMGLAPLAACGDDESAQDRYCEAGDQLRSDITALLDLDVLATGTDGLRESVDEVESSFDELRSNASDAAEDEVDALGDALDDVDDALADLGDDLSRENVSNITGALGAAAGAATGVFDTLTDCP